MGHQRWRYPQESTFAYLGPRLAAAELGEFTHTIGKGALERSTGRCGADSVEQAGLPG
jgi:hypothetical protein